MLLYIQLFTYASVCDTRQWMRLAQSHWTMLKLKTARFLTRDSQFCFAASVSSGDSDTGKQSHSHFLNAVFSFSLAQYWFKWPHTHIRTHTPTCTYHAPRNKLPPPPLHLQKYIRERQTQSWLTMSHSGLLEVKADKDDISDSFTGSPCTEAKSALHIDDHLYLQSNTQMHSHDVDFKKVFKIMK